jgi:hypothetical protein
VATILFDNLDDVMNWVQESIDGFTFNLQGDNEPTLGEDCAADIADGIRTRSIYEKRGARGQWRENEPEYAGWKFDKYDVEGTNFRTDIDPASMLSLQALKGVPAVTPHQVTMQHGLDRAPSSSRTGYLNKSDTRRTDREKGVFAHNDTAGGGRSFYELDEIYTNEPVYLRLWQRLYEWLDQRNHT